MYTHPAKQLPTVAINALWCLLIALALLTFPILARHARLQIVLEPHSTQLVPAASGDKVQPAAGIVYVSQADPTAPSR